MAKDEKSTNSTTNDDDNNLTVTIETNNESIIKIPKPYSKACLEKNTLCDDTGKKNSISFSNGKDDSLLHLAKACFSKLSTTSRNNNHTSSFSSTNTNTNTNTSLWTPTPIQLQSWPILKREDGQSKNSSSSFSCLNLMAIAQTGSGKTLSYSIPMIDSIVQNHDKKKKKTKAKAKEKEKASRRVHGLVLVPTRELAIQVSKVLKMVAKSKNKILNGNNKEVVSLAIYGGVDKQEQIDLLLKNKNSTGNNDKKNVVDIDFVIAATPMRLIDLLGIQRINTDTAEETTTTNNDNENENDSSESDKQTKKIQKLFKYIKYIVMDEADQVAIKPDMSGQVDLILQFIQKKSLYVPTRCLFSATLPLKAIEKCNEWIHKPRVVVKVDTVTVGGDRKNTGNSDGTFNDTNNDDLKADVVKKNESNQKEKEMNDETTDNIEEESEDNKKKKKKQQQNYSGPLDLSQIPSHITQTLHVCSNHKKPKKLFTTIHKIRNGVKQSTTTKRRQQGLIIVFFARIKTLNYIHSLLEKKEQIKCCPFHSQMNQQKREFQLQLFKSGKKPILLSTDIAGRGIHINNVEYIINYDFPSSLEQYVHRCGRAGRTKKKSFNQGESSTNADISKDGKEANQSSSSTFLNATVYSFFNRELAPMAKDLIQLLHFCNAWIDPNLISLVPADQKESLSSILGEQGESKRQQRKRINDNKRKLRQLKEDDEEGKDDYEASKRMKRDKDQVNDIAYMGNPSSSSDDEKEFAHLGKPPAFLKKATNFIVESSSSESESESED